MDKNIGTPGRLLRFIFSILLFTLSWWYSSWIAFGFGLFTLYEAVASWCVLYQFLGKNSCPSARSIKRKDDL